MERAISVGLRILAATSLLVLSAPSFVSAQAEDAVDALQHAHRLFDTGELTDARSAYQAAIEQGTRAPAGLALAYRRLGILEATFNESDLAQRSFQRTIAIDPTQDVPDSLSPSQQTLFRALRDQQQGQAGALTIEAEPRDSGTTLVTSVNDLPAGWVTSYRASAGDWSVTGEDRAVQVPREVVGDGIDVQIEALDAYGNIIARASTRAVLAAPASAPLGGLEERGPSVTEPSSDSSNAGLWIVLGSAAAVGIALAIILPLVLSTEQNVYGPALIEWQ